MEGGWRGLGGESPAAGGQWGSGGEAPTRCRLGAKLPANRRS